MNRNGVDSVDELKKPVRSTTLRLLEIIVNSQPKWSFWGLIDVGQADVT